MKKINRNKSIILRMTAEEKELLEQLAYDNSMNISNYIRHLLFHTNKVAVEQAKIKLKKEI